MKCIDKAIGWIVKNWERVPDSDHPNAADLLVVAHIISTTCKTNLPDYNLGEDESKAIIEKVGDYVFDPPRVRARGGEVIIRRRPAVQLREEMRTLDELLSDQMISIGVGEVALLKALFLTGAFYTMSRATRSEAFGQESPDTVDRRLNTYKMLSQISEQNSWARSGVILVRSLRPNTPMVENWIPEKSVYWQEMFSHQDVQV